MSLSSNNAVLTALNAVTALCQAGAGNGVLELWSGTPPTDTSPGDAGDGDALATFDLGTTAFASAVDLNPHGRASSGNVPISTTGDVAGTVTHARLKDSDGNFIHQYSTVGLTGSGAEVELSNTNIAVDQDITLTALHLTLRESPAP